MRNSIIIAYLAEEPEYLEFSQLLMVSGVANGNEDNDDYTVFVCLFQFNRSLFVHFFIIYFFRFLLRVCLSIFVFFVPLYGFVSFCRYVCACIRVCMCASMCACVCLFPLPPHSPPPPSFCVHLCSGSLCLSRLTSSFRMYPFSFLCSSVFVWKQFLVFDPSVFASDYKYQTVNE